MVLLVIAEGFFMSHVNSKDPRKYKIMLALKIKSGGSKVTLLEEIKPGVFKGHCQKQEIIVDQAGYAHKTGKWTTLGDFTVTKEEVGL